MAILVLAVAACSSDDGDSSGSSGPSGDTPAEIDLSTFQEIVDDAMAPLDEWTGPTEAVEPPEDVKVVVITAIGAAEGALRPADGAVAAAEAVGWDASLVDAQGDVTAMQTAISTAVAQDADVIILSAIGQALVSAQVAEARAAGIVVISLNANDDEGADDGVNAAVDMDRAQSGRALGALAVIDRAGEANTLVLEDEQYVGITLTVEGFKEVSDQCEGCSYTTQTAAATELQTVVPGAVTSELQRSPDINGIVFYDAALSLILPALETAGLADQVNLYGFDGNADILEAVRQGTVRADAAAPWEWAGWAGIDLAARILVDGDLDVSSIPHELPWRIVTEDNIPAEGESLAEVDYEAEFRGLWGLG